MSRYEHLFRSALDGITPFGGDRVLAKCPFHNDDDPSLSVDLASGLWYCFGCGEKGNAKTFAKRLRLGDIATPPPTLGRLQSRLAALRRRSDYTPPPETSISTLYPGVEVWQNFRSIGAESVRRWELGYDPLADALLIPVRAVDRAPIGIIRRYLAPVGTQPRYHYPPGFPRRTTVYGLHLVRSDWAVLVEGSLDAVAVDEVGYPAIATLGSRISPEQALAIRKAGITTLVTAFDNDEAGYAATVEMPTTLRGFRRIHVSWDGITEKDVAEMPPSDRRLFIAQHLPKAIREESRTKN